MTKKLLGLLFVLLGLFILSGCVTTGPTLNGQQQNQDLQSEIKCQDSCTDKENLKDWISNQFGINSEQYTILCSECLLERGGHFRVKLLINNEPIDAYYQSGWCSSGGSECGWKVAFTSHSEKNDDVYESVKKRICSKLYSLETNDGNLCKGDKNYDNSTLVRNNCMAGLFEKIDGDTKTIAINQYSNRCNSFVEDGNFSKII